MSKKKNPKPQQLLWAHEVPRSPRSSPCGGYPGAGGNPVKSAGSVQVPKTEDIRLRLPPTPGRPPAPRRAAPYRPGEGAELPGGQEAVLEAGRQPRLGHGPPEWPRPGSPVAPAEGPRRRRGCAGSRTRHPTIDTPRRCPPPPRSLARADDAALRAVPTSLPRAAAKDAVPAGRSGSGAGPGPAGAMSGYSPDEKLRLQQLRVLRRRWLRDQELSEREPVLPRRQLGPVAAFWERFLQPGGLWRQQVRGDTRAGLPPPSRPDEGTQGPGPAGPPPRGLTSLSVSPPSPVGVQGLPDRQLRPDAGAGPCLDHPLLPEVPRHGACGPSGGL